MYQRRIRHCSHPDQRSVQAVEKLHLTCHDSQPEFSPVLGSSVRNLDATFHEQPGNKVESDRNGPVYHHAAK